VPRSESADVVVVGTTCLDVKARPLAPVQPGISNPARIRLCPGGTGRNVAENLARLGVRVSLLSTVGNDLLGQRLLENTARAGVDTSRVLRTSDHYSATYLALYTQDVKSGYLLDDVTQLKAATPEYLFAQKKLFRNAKMVVLDGNLDTETIAAAIDLAKKSGTPVAVDPATVRRAYALRPYLSEFAMITPNVAEAEALMDRKITGGEDALEVAREIVAQGVEIVVISMADDGLVYATSQGYGQGHGRIGAIRCEVEDWTGAGDALSAAVIYGLLNDMPVDDCMRLGVAAATLALKSIESVNPDMSLEQLYANMVI
jgi:pseudouridine kinase